MSERDGDDCVWELDDPDYDSWSSSCGGHFTLNDGTPSQNRMKFCCYCGCPITEHIPAPEIEEEL